MPHKTPGSVYESRGRWYAQVRVSGKRVSIPLPTCATRDAALVRLAALAPLAADLRAHEVPAARAVVLLTAAGAAIDGRAMARVRATVAVVCRGETKPIAAKKLVTIQDVGEQWTSGELSRQYPDHVRDRKGSAEIAAKLVRHVYPIGGPVAVAAFTLDDAQQVMSALSPDLEGSTRAQLARLLARILSLAVFPLRLREASPLPRGWVPKGGSQKALAHLYPDEDAQLLACPGVPLGLRVLYGFLDREGMRHDEASRITWSDLDLARGAIELPTNKTNDPRSWALDAGVARALAKWRELAPAGAAEVFPPLGQWPANRFRTHLQAAGVRRGALFERSPARRPIRLHDTRATFITTALANGRTETWVADRTGHKSSAMINRYRRAARTVAELGLGELRPLDVAIPELAELAAGSAAAEAKSRDGGRETAKSASSGKTNQDAEREATASSAEVLPPAGDGREPSPEAAAGPGPSGGRSPSPRAGLLASLLQLAQQAAEAGDLQAAKVAHEAAGKLLGSPNDGAPIVDLARERDRRGR